MQTCRFLADAEHKTNVDVRRGQEHLEVKRLGPNVGTHAIGKEDTLTQEEVKTANCLMCSSEMRHIKNSWETPLKLKGA
jgi:hypothetical protein